MILLVHLLFGAAIASYIKNPALAVVLAFLSHYFLDFFPHIEYGIENIERKQWKTAMSQIFKVLLDFCSGVLLIFLFSNNHPIVYICAFFAILPDGLTFLGYFSKNKFSELHKKFHQKKIHFFKNKKISNFWRVSTQFLAVIISIILLKL